MYLLTVFQNDPMYTLLYLQTLYIILDHSETLVAVKYFCQTHIRDNTAEQS